MAVINYYKIKLYIDYDLRLGYTYNTYLLVPEMTRYLFNYFLHQVKSLAEVV